MTEEGSFIGTIDRAIWGIDWGVWMADGAIRAIDLGIRAIDWAVSMADRGVGTADRGVRVPAAVAGSSPFRKMKKAAPLLGVVRLWLFRVFAVVGGETLAGLRHPILRSFCSRSQMRPFLAVDR